MNMRYSCKWAVLILIVLNLFQPVLAYAQEDDEKKHVSLTLAHAIELALQNNRGLSGTVLSEQNAALSLAITQSAFDVKWAPEASAGISHEEETTQQGRAGVLISKQFQVGASATFGPGVDFTEDDTSADMALSLSIPLLRGLGREVTLDPVFSARQGLKSAQRSLHLNRVALVVETVDAVYSILQQQDLVQLYERQVSALESQARLSEAKERAGLATPMDVYRAQIQTKEVQESATRAREALVSAEDRLKLILAKAPEERLSVTAPRRAEPVEINGQEAIDLALLNRVEISQAEDHFTEALRQAGISKDNVKPELNLVLKYRLYGEPVSDMEEMDLNENAWSVNLASDTDWSRKAEKAAYQQSLNGVRSARLQLQAKKDDIKEEVRRQLEVVRQARERIQIRQEQIEQAEAKLALAEIKVRYNMTDNFDLIEASTQLEEAEVAHLSTVKDYILGTYRLRAAIGTLLERPEGI